MKIVYSPRCLEYQQVGHPESPARVRIAAAYLEKRGFEFLEPEPASDQDLLLVHTPEHIRRVESGDFYDPDCPVYPDIGLYARLAVGGAILAQEVEGFSLMRPPGHHAGPNSLGGFCYFNNIAVAVRRSGRKTLIVDIDGHHGNGTEAVFYGDGKVTYVSLHQHYNYPGTGQNSRGNCLNYPLLPRCGSRVYLGTLKQALEDASRFGPFEQLAISAGFDTYRDDPLASMGLEIEDYRKIGKILGKLRLPTFAVLEGGYVPDIIGPAIEVLVEGLGR
ncbi:MAG TPA: histone deacetylase [Candidatus Acetothermia bacterium]|nr:histone deacetylase [Candidatus Acetothermia bacterium]